MCDLNIILLRRLYYRKTFFFFFKPPNCGRRSRTGAARLHFEIYESRNDLSREDLNLFIQVVAEVYSYYYHCEYHYF